MCSNYEKPFNYDFEGSATQVCHQSKKNYRHICKLFQVINKSSESFSVSSDLFSLNKQFSP